MNADETQYTLRAKVIGIMLRKARKNAQLSAEEIANLCGIPADDYSAFENGEKAPTLPQLELIALATKTNPDILLDRSESDSEAPWIEAQKLATLLNLRKRMIGAEIRKHRSALALSVEELAERANLPPETLEQLEFGETQIEVPQLEQLCKQLGISIVELLDKHGPIGRRLQAMRSFSTFAELPPEIQDFVGKPINRPYLEIAMKLSEMSVEKLRTVAETLLDITL